jgi:hypothetical protein
VLDVEISAPEAPGEPVDAGVNAPTEADDTSNQEESEA